MTYNAQQLVINPFLIVMASTEIAPEYIEHIKPLLGEGIDAFICACKTPLRKSIRINRLKETGREAYRNQGIDCEIPWWQGGFWLKESSPLANGNHKLHLQGGYYIQEASSMLPAAALLHKNALPEAPLILDMAAAPGSKTTQLAGALGNRGCIIANELSSTRLKYLSANVQRMGVTNTCLTHFDGVKFGEYLPNTFDAIILDAPCGGEGTVRKDINALKDWSIQSVLDMSQLQKQLIRSAFISLKPGGTLIYSTCTLSTEENQQVCLALQNEFGEQLRFESLEGLFDDAATAITPEGFLHVFPHFFDSEGFFIAKIRKLENKQNTEEQRPRKYLKQFPFQPVSKKTKQLFFDYLKQQFGITSKSINGNLWQRDKELWLFPQQIEELIGVIKFNKIGLKVAEVYPKNFRTTYDFAMAFGHLATLNIIDISLQDAEQYMMGKDLTAENRTLSGEQILKSDNLSIGLAKANKGKLKNQLPRELVKDKLDWKSLL